MSRSERPIAASQCSAILVGCVKSKGTRSAPARELYQSQLWAGRRQYAEDSGLPWLILSAKYGVLDPDDRVEPYDLALSDLAARSRTQWGERAVADLAARLGRLDGK